MRSLLLLLLLGLPALQLLLLRREQALHLSLGRGIKRNGLLPDPAELPRQSLRMAGRERRKYAAEGEQIERSHSARPMCLSS